jgi:hypothetical protein
MLRLMIVYFNASEYSILHAPGITRCILHTVCLHTGSISKHALLRQIDRSKGFGEVDPIHLRLVGKAERQEGNTNFVNFSLNVSRISFQSP